MFYHGHLVHPEIWQLWFSFFASVLNIVGLVGYVLVKEWYEKKKRVENADRQGLCEYSAIHRETYHYQEPGCINWKPF